MKTSSPLFAGVPRALSALLLVWCLGVNAVRAAGRQVTLQAIHHLENPRNLTRPGPCGELGPYQFRFTTWRMHTTIPFARAIDREISEHVAVQHYDWLNRGLVAARMPATPYNIALAWNGGLAAAVAGKSPRAAHRYAERAANLAGAFSREQGVATAR